MIECDDCPYYRKNHFVGKWHRYPDEKPKEEKEYIVTTENGDVAVSAFWNDAMACGFERVDVIAWAEMPRPCIGGIR